MRVHGSFNSITIQMYCLAGDVGFSDILKEKEGNCALPSRTPPLSPGAGFPTRQGKLAQNLAYGFLFAQGNSNK